MAALEDFGGILHRMQKLDSRFDRGTAVIGHIGEIDDIQRHLVNIVKRDGLRDILNDVEDVIHLVDQLMNLVTIEWRDERRMQLLKGVKFWNSLFN